MPIVFLLYNTRSYSLMTSGYSTILGKIMPLQYVFQAMLITTYKEANQQQNSYIILPTATINVPTSHVCCCKPSANS